MYSLAEVAAVADIRHTRLRIDSRRLAVGPGDVLSFRRV